MSDETTEYTPNNTPHPSETVRLVMNEKGIPREELADLLGVEPTFARLVYHGELAFTPKLAGSVEEALGIPADFIMNRQERVLEEMRDQTDAIADQITSLNAEDLEALVEQCPRLEVDDRMTGQSAASRQAVRVASCNVDPVEVARKETDGAGEAASEGGDQ